MTFSHAITTAATCLVALLLGPCSFDESTSGDHPAPFLVQVENASDARPQSGLQNAAVVYEYVTEGGISRFSAIYTSSPSAKVGPIRSARLVTISLGRMYGAIVVYSGGSTYIREQIGSAGIAHVDEDSANGDLFRDSSRAAPHNLYSDGSHLSDAARHVNAPAVSWSLWQRTAVSSVTGGKPTGRVTVPVSDTERPIFAYDASAGVWKRTETDTGALVDANTRAPLAISTLIVQQVNVKPTAAVVDVMARPGSTMTLRAAGRPRCSRRAGNLTRPGRRARAGHPRSRLTAARRRSRQGWSGSLWSLLAPRQRELTEAGVMLPHT